MPKEGSDYTSWFSYVDAALKIDDNCYLQVFL